jgi:hypothetical protein
MPSSIKRGVPLPSSATALGIMLGYNGDLMVITMNNNGK